MLIYSLLFADQYLNHHTLCLLKPVAKFMLFPQNIPSSTMCESALCTQGWISKWLSGVTSPSADCDIVMVTVAMVPSSSALHVTVPYRSQTSSIFSLSY